MFSMSAEFDVKGVQNIDAGYSLMICIKCQNRHQEITYQYTVTQEVGCNTLQVNAALGDGFDFDYSNTIGYIDLLDATSFFTNSKPADCPYQFCQLKATDCSSPFESLNRLQIDLSNSIQGVKNVEEGYRVELCVLC